MSDKEPNTFDLVMNLSPRSFTVSDIVEEFGRRYLAQFTDDELKAYLKECIDTPFWRFNPTLVKRGAVLRRYDSATPQDIARQAAWQAELKADPRKQFGDTPEEQARTLAEAAAEGL